MFQQLLAQKHWPRHPKLSPPSDLVSCGSDLMDPLSSEAASRASGCLVRLLLCFPLASPASPQNPETRIYTRAYTSPSRFFSSLPSTHAGNSDGGCGRPPLPPPPHALGRQRVSPRFASSSSPSLPPLAGPRVLDETLAAPSSLPTAAAASQLVSSISWYVTPFSSPSWTRGCQRAGCGGAGARAARREVGEGGPLRPVAVGLPLLCKFLWKFFCRIFKVFLVNQCI